MEVEPNDPNEDRTIGKEGNVKTFEAPERRTSQLGRFVVWVIAAAVVVILLIRWIF